MSDTLLAKKKKNAANAWGVFFFFVLIVIDLVTKLIADVYFAMPNAREEITIIPGVAVLRMVYNRGISFGVGSDASKMVKLAVLIGTGVLMFVFSIVFFRLDSRRKFLRVALVLVIAGGIGNLIDRLYYHVWDPASYQGGFRDGVRDMVDLTFSFIGFSAVCNGADFWITFGAGVLILALLFFDRDAVFPVGKYKAMAKAHEEETEKAKAAKAERKEKKTKNNG